MYPIENRKSVEWMGTQETPIEAQKFYGSTPHFYLGNE